MFRKFSGDSLDWLDFHVAIKTSAPSVGKLIALDVFKSHAP
jgi:hypothetical protein